jgi:hypothetical protein
MLTSIKVSLSSYTSDECAIRCWSGAARTAYGIETCYWVTPELRLYVAQAHSSGFAMATGI